MLKIPGKTWALSALSGGLQVLIFPTPAWSFLAWIAVTPLLLALLQRPSQEVLRPGAEPGLTVGQGFWLGYFCGFSWYLGSCYWVFHVMNSYGGLPVPVAAGILLLFCLYLGLYHALFAALVVRVARKNLSLALFATPFLWVAVELARSRVTGFPWDLLGTAQVDNLLLTRIVPFTGVYGLSLVIAVVNVLFVAAALARRKKVVIGIIAFTSAATLQNGSLWKPPASPATHLARLVQQNVPITNSPWTADQFDRTIAELADLSRQPKNSAAPPDWSSSPRLIIWPESPSPFYVNDPKLTTWLGTLASDQNAFIIAGSLGLRSPTGGGDYDIFNSATLVAPSGAFLARYDKVHLVPFGEYVPFQELLFFAKNLTKQVGTFSRGVDRTVFKLPSNPVAAPVEEHHHHEGMVMPEAAKPAVHVGEGYRIGTFICYESVFPDEIRLFALNGAQVFVNISNDGWFGRSGAPGQHLNMARMRAIENKRWLLRSTNTGITASIDPFGRVVTQAERDVRTALNAPYAFVAETTFYTRHGDWLAYACAIISFIALFVRFNLRAGILR
ncbi:MAG TPA: apolipoprotein N-acyltransferase [Terriglobales bacterium]|nr:apolipoprotein N-acyltransferase [Terriglobales bacterium]